MSSQSNYNFKKKMVHVQNKYSLVFISELKQISLVLDRCIRSFKHLYVNGSRLVSL